MKALAFDTETHTFRPGCMAPRLVCVTWQRPGVDAKIDIAANMKPRVQDWLLDDELILVGHNVPYDLAVFGAYWPEFIPLIFRKFDRLLVTDTWVRQHLIDIATGKIKGWLVNGVWTKPKYSLLDLTGRLLSKTIFGKDSWRMLYGDFDGVPIDQWPARAVEVRARELEACVTKTTELLARRAAETNKTIRTELDKELAKVDKSKTEWLAATPESSIEYPLDDARNTLAVYQKQEEHRKWLGPEFVHTRDSWWLHLTAAWGLRTDREGVTRFREQTLADLDTLERELMIAGLVRDDKERSRDTKAAKDLMVKVMGELGKKPRETATGGISLDADACAASEDETLKDYSRLSTLKSMLAKDVPMLEGGLDVPVHTRFGLAASLRSTSFGPNIQNLRNPKIDDPGDWIPVRECFVPRPGKVFLDLDFPGLELHTLAQACMKLFGYSKLAEIINNGQDAHLVVAAAFAGISYEKAAELYAAEENAPKGTPKPISGKRKAAKPFNFGGAGGMGAKKFVVAARKSYGVVFTEAEVKANKKLWLQALPEVQALFDHVAKLTDNELGETFIDALFPEFGEAPRGRVGYCDGCNTYFQRLGAMIAKRAGWLISRECYAVEDSPLFDARIVNFVHDEYILEVDEARGDAAGRRVAELMAIGANRFFPDVPYKPEEIKPVMMRRWSKDATTVRDASGKLIVWERAA